MGLNPMKGVTNEVVNLLFKTGNSALGTSSGTIFEQSGFATEGHMGFIGGLSFNPFPKDNSIPVEITGAEIGNVGGALYGTASLVIPVWKNPDREFANLLSNSLEEFILNGIRGLLMRHVQDGGNK